MPQVAVLGSTGSIGTSCLDVIESLQSESAQGKSLPCGEMTLCGVTAYENWESLRQQCEQFSPRWAVLADESLRDVVSQQSFSRVNNSAQATELQFGAEKIEELARHPDVDIVISGIVGVAGLRGTWAAVESGKIVGIANKEPLVVAGQLLMELAEQHGATLIPVDSEHSAIFQALQAGRRDQVRRVVLTASGGPFFGWSKKQLENVTPEMALKHPTWTMGPKITVDSATMMNKALEIIEAKWLFGLEADQIEVMVHPQSMIHSFVEYLDGSVIAQLSPPDMKLPIQYALTYPHRVDGPAARVDWKTAMQWELFPPDFDAFPALQLGFDVANRGGSCGAVLNAANEAAIERFLAGTLSFCEITEVCRSLVDSHVFQTKPTLSELIQFDDWARKKVQQY